MRGGGREQKPNPKSKTNHRVSRVKVQLRVMRNAYTLLVGAHGLTLCRGVLLLCVFFIYDYPLLLAAVLLVLSSIYRPLVAYVSCEHMYVSLKPTLGVGGLEATRCFHFLNRTPSPRGSFGSV